MMLTDELVQIVANLGEFVAVICVVAGLLYAQADKE
jgi:hypothetical protein